MKANTSKLYAQMKPRELAEIYHRTYDAEERSRITLSVPKYNYRCIDAEFVDHVDNLRCVSLWWVGEWWHTVARLNEETCELIMFGSNQKAVANVYASRLKALENALTQFDLGHIQADSGIDMNADGLVMVNELELLPDHVERFTDSIVKVMTDALEA